MKKFRVLMMLFVASMLAGCTNKDLKEDNSKIDETLKNEDVLVNEEVNEEAKEEVSIEDIIAEYSPNELGDIPVIMYHAVLPDAPTVYQRSIEGFKEDLEYMYTNNYSLISMQDYINFNIDVEPGKTPIVITFDDGEEGTFNLIKDEEGNLVVNPDSAIGIMEAFEKEHEGFKSNAALYMNGHDSSFGNVGTIEERVNWLFDNGYEVGNHTNTHFNLKKADGFTLQKEIGIVDKKIKDIRSDAPLNTITFPFGAKPSEDLIKYVYNGNYSGHEYSYDIGFREGPSTPRFKPVIHKDFDPMNAPRLRGNKGEEGDMYSYFDTYERYPERRFVSDGDSTKITVPKDLEENINKEKIGEMEVITY